VRAWRRRHLLPSLTRAWHWHWHRHWRVLRAPRSVRSGQPAWLEPDPGPFAAAPRGSAPAPGDSPETASLVFVAALQRLPPRQRVALVLTDVFGFGAAEVAEILDCGVGKAERLVTRARAAIAPLTRQGSAVEDAVIARFTGAFGRGDVAGIAALLTSDAWLRLRPLPVEYQGRDAARHFFESVAFPGGTSRYRLVATRANGQPAFGCYLRDPEDGRSHACGLVVLTIAGDRIAAIDRFVDNSLMPRFGLPRTLPGD
jgi:DNA-directed RNA polymerase specialized sigma24 family protein/ketosteroid isomerase-like protein